MSEKMCFDKDRHRLQGLVPLEHLHRSVGRNSGHEQILAALLAFVGIQDLPVPRSPEVRGNAAGGHPKTVETVDRFVASPCESALEQRFLSVVYVFLRVIFPLIATRHSIT